MDDASVVSMPKPQTDIVGNFKNLSPIEVMPFLLNVEQTVSLHQFHREKEHRILLPVTENADNVGMVKLNQSFDFRFKTTSKMRIMSISRRKNFNRVKLTGIFVAGAVNGPHPAATKDSLKLIWADRIECH